jgi:hypothetical protein
MKPNIIGSKIDPKVHREYFFSEFKKRFGYLNYKEESERKGKKNR